MPNDEVARLTHHVTERDHVQGLPDAPVTLVEYGDFECPYCARAHPIVKEIQRRLGSHLRFVFRHFPLKDIHPHAGHAAETAEAAAAQATFWEMHDTLFEHQHALDDRHLVDYAAAMELDARRVHQELASHTYAPRVDDDVMSGVRSGVKGTPTFFINGVRHDDSWDLDTLERAVRAEIP